MRVFDKVAREELKNDIKLKEMNYVSEYARMQLNSAQLPNNNFSRNGMGRGGAGYGTCRDKSANWAAGENCLIGSTVKRTAVKYSFPQ